MYAQSRQIFLLDLCIFAYQLHSQTLIWPMDPYFDQWGKPFALLTLGQASNRRNDYIQNLRTRAAAYRQAPTCRGPADFFGGAGWNANQGLDPILSRYDRVNPWRPSFTRQQPGGWVLYNTPNVITDRIQTVYTVTYPANNGPSNQPPYSAMDVTQLPQAGPNQGTDVLYCCEGGTGATVAPAEANWSIMAFVLAEFAGAPARYNVYIVFRGSRSGLVKPGRLIKQNRNETRGNPDWVTDLASLGTSNDLLIANVQNAAVSSGFRHTVANTMPTVLAALNHLQTSQGQVWPTSIFVTGHSLGAALAAQFTSAVLLGDNAHYGPDGTGQMMPPALKNWPWLTLSLTTFGPPAVGSPLFRKAFDGKTACQRIWVSGDPVPELTQKINEPVGYPVVLPRYDLGRTKARLDIDIAAHEPSIERLNLLTDMVNNNRPTNNIPASTAGNVSEPWQNFTSLESMMRILQGLQNWMDLFQDFKANYVKYIDPLIDMAHAAGDGNLANALTILHTQESQQAVPTPNGIATYMQPLQAALGPGALGSRDPNPWDFFRIGYLMCRLSESQASFNTALQHGLIQADYNSGQLA